MPEPTELPRRLRRSPSRLRAVLGIAFGVAFVILVILWNSAGLYTDYLWFESVDHGSVWSSILRTRIFLGFLFTAAFFAVLWANLVIADRLAPRFLPGGAEDEMLERYQEIFAGRSGRLRATVSLVFAMIAGVGVSSRWVEWMLYRNAVDVGIEDPLHGTDVGFYLFKLPFYSFVIDWVFASLIIVVIITGVAHYLNGGIRVQQPIQRVTPQVKAHLSVLLGALALIRAFDYWLQRFELTVSTRGTVDGALYTDVEAKLPALSLLVLISIFAAGLFIYNIRRRGWALPIVAVGLWAFVAIVVGTVYPAITQRFRVEPDESAREAPYLVDNVGATQAALGLDNITMEDDFSSNGEPLSAATVSANRSLLDQLILLDPQVMEQNIEAEESKVQFYRFVDVDVDRYQVDGATTPVLLAVRELDQAELPGTGWEAKHVTYTHGYGVVMAPANQPDGGGNPEPDIGDLPIRLTDSVDPGIITEPRVYFGEGMSSYAIVKTDRREQDGTNNFEPYEGAGGVPMGSTTRQLAFALRFGDLNPLISNFINDESEVLYVRDVRERVHKVAPFLAFDSDPYPVLVDGRVQYVVDGYTTSARYPYGQRADVSDLSQASDLRRRLNYVRNSVKAVVDGYDGSVTLYAQDAESDPIIEVWRRAFPDLFVSFDEMPAELLEHFRYPTDLFRLQTNMWGRYQLTDPQEFYDETKSWTVAQDPGDSQGTVPPDVAAADPLSGAPTVRARRIDPFYQMYSLPADEDPTFSLVRSFVKKSGSGDNSGGTKLLTGLMVGRSEPGADQYNRLHLVATPELPSGPAIAQAQLVGNDTISRALSLLDDTGSGVLFGDMMILPVDDTILYVRPVYLQSESQTEVPHIEAVMVSDGKREVMTESLNKSLTALLGTEPDDSPLTPPENDIDNPPPDADPGSTGEAIADVREALEELLAELEGLEQTLEDSAATADDGGNASSDNEADSSDDQANDDQVENEQANDEQTDSTE